MGRLLKLGAQDPSVAANFNPIWPKMAQVKDMLRRSGRSVVMAENCTMANEKLYHSVDEIPDDAGYFSLIIAKEKK